MLRLSVRWGVKRDFKGKVGISGIKTFCESVTSLIELEGGTKEVRHCPLLA